MSGVQAYLEEHILQPLPAKTKGFFCLEIWFNELSSNCARGKKRAYKKLTQTTRRQIRNTCFCLDMRKSRYTTTTDTSTNSSGAKAPTLPFVNPVLVSCPYRSRSEPQQKQILLLVPQKLRFASHMWVLQAAKWGSPHAYDGD